MTSTPSNNPTEDDLLKMSQIPLPEGTLGYYPPDSIRKAAARPVASNNLKEPILSNAVQAYYWGDDWPGDYPAWDVLTSEQHADLLRLKKLFANERNLILDTILASEEMQDSLAPGDSKAAAEKTASTWYWECKGKDQLRADLRTMLEGMK